MLVRSAKNALTFFPFRLGYCTHSKGGTTARTLPRRYASIATLPPSRDDIALVALFDQPSVARSSLLIPTGLFGHPSIIDPHSLITLADATLVRAKLLTERILHARQSRDELLKVVKNLDRLSDMLCGVIDLAELVRNTHPNAQWVDAANAAYEALCEFMNVLNTHVGLYEVRKN
jgi:intermediate peptidase